MKNIILLFISAFFIQCKTGINYYQGYIFSIDNNPIKNLKIYEKYDRNNYAISNKYGYFRIDITKNNIKRYLIIENEGRVIDSIQVIGTQGGEKIKYSFVQGENDTLFLNMNKKTKVLKPDSTKHAKSLAIVKGNLIKSESGDKYLYSKISIKEVLLNKTDYNFEDTIKVAYYNWHKGVPENKDCIIYLVPWPLGSKMLDKNNQWMLMEGNGEHACECK